MHLRMQASFVPWQSASAGRKTTPLHACAFTRLHSPSLASTCEVHSGPSFPAPVFFTCPAYAFSAGPSASGGQAMESGPSGRMAVAIGPPPSFAISSRMVPTGS